ncbi:hypothetical protein G7Y89_g12484 [Cudoniella acicularis]|uniref:Rhodopsin domain-containing protein n=1 Tax=Cudoniella acicularis TaxID=354080 RepID=A0A8H4VZ44_9HELO|nr:hypothetical protein G7Y89_g12484 [Cudoniella acicularis]
MQFSTFSLFTVLLAGSAIATAVPSDENHGLERRGCPGGWELCGNCDGTSCSIKFWGIPYNYGCDVGSCTEQSGAGNGVQCVAHNYDDVHCPGNGGKTCREVLLVISQPTPLFLSLVEKAAHDNYDKTISDTNTITKLDFTGSCGDVQKEFKRSYLDSVGLWQPSTFVLTGGSFRIQEKLSAVAIPLVKDGSPRIEYYDSRRVTSPVDWNIGSVIYLAGDSSLMSDGYGNTSFILLLFTMKTVRVMRIGPVVQWQPNLLLVNDPEMLPNIHHPKSNKTPHYNMFTSGIEGLVQVKDWEKHRDFKKNELGTRYDVVVMLTQSHFKLLTSPLHHAPNCWDPTAAGFQLHQYYKHNSDMSGTIILTGANSSLAIPAVNYLFSNYPSYTAVLTVRNTSDSDENTGRLRQEISKFPAAKASVRALDLSSLSEVELFSNQIVTDISNGALPPLVAIICNAYAWSISNGLKHSKDGYEISLAVNHLAHLSLVLRLLGSFGPQGRITFLASDSHYPGKNGLEKYAPGLPDDLNLLAHPTQDRKGEEVGRGFQRYGNSKLAVIMGMYELNKLLLQDPKLRKITAVAMDPGGLVDSRTMNEGVPSTWKYAMKGFLSPMRPLLKHFIPTLRSVNESSIDLIEISVGKLNSERGYFTLLKKDDSSPESKDEEKQQRLWAKSLEWAHVSKNDTVLQGAIEATVSYPILKSDRKVEGRRHFAANGQDSSAALKEAKFSYVQRSGDLTVRSLRYGRFSPPVSKPNPSKKYTKRFRTFGLDDWAMIPAPLLYIGHTIMACYVNLNGGIGKPLWEVSVGEFEIGFKGIVGSAFLYPAMTAAIRTSIILFYHRIFCKTMPRFRLAVYIYLALTSMYAVTFSIIPGTICSPLSASWHPLVRHVYCKSDYFYYNYQVALYSCSVAGDAILLFFPLYPVTKLMIPNKKRVGVTIMFMLGASACIAVSYKLAIFVLQMKKYDHIDPRWLTTIMSRVVPPQFDEYGYTFWIPSQVEPTVALIGSSLPAMGQVVVKASKHISSSFSSLSHSKLSQKSRNDGPYKNIKPTTHETYHTGKETDSEVALQSSYELGSLTEDRIER